jgi:hypothetical protein
LLFISLQYLKDEASVIQNSLFLSGLKAKFIEYSCWFLNLVPDL